MKTTISVKVIFVVVLLALVGISGGLAAGYFYFKWDKASDHAKGLEYDLEDVEGKLQAARDLGKKRLDDVMELKRKLYNAKKRIRELEATSELAKANVLGKGAKATILDEEAESDNVSIVSVSTNGDVMAELERQLPKEAFHEATNVLSRLRSKLAERAKGRLDYIASVDASRMSKAERDNHAKFLKLLEKREALRSKMTGFIPNPSVLQEMVELDLSMQPVAKQERSALVREVARELGYSGEDVDVFHDTMASIYDSTSGGGLNSLMEAASDMQVEDASDNGEAPKVNVGVQTHVIGL